MNAPLDTSAGQQTLHSLVKKSRVIVCVGSGGVGKTTTAAGLAIYAGRLGKRAAVLTIDPARRLAQALGLPKMGNEPRPLSSDIVAPGSVDAMMLETAEAFDDLIQRLVPEPERQQKLLNNRLYQVVARQLGGTHEYMAVEKLFALYQSGDYDLIVLDTPPSVNALDFLDAPTRVANFFSEKIQRFFINRSDEQKRGLFQKLKDRAGEMALQVLGKTLGEPFIEDVQDFATAFQGLFGAFRERGQAIERLLADPTTSFIVISGADPVRVSEALEFSRTLKRFKVEPKAFIANRVHTVSAPDEVPSAEGIRQALATAPDAALSEVDLTKVLLGARATRRQLARRDSEGLGNMRRAAGPGRMLVVPELDQEVEDRGAVEHLLAALGGPSPQTT